jgi:uncharacterized protein
MIVVADSTPLIYLAAIGRFNLLQTLYGRITIPLAVYQEVVVQGAGRWGAAETGGADWIDRCAVADPSKLSSLQGPLDGGEREVIALAEQVNANLVIMDETAGRQELAKRGMSFLGTVGVLIQAKQRGLIVALKPEMDQLRASGFHLSDRVYRACLASAGE